MEIRSGKYTDALSYSQKIIDVDPKHIDGLLIHGFASVGQSELRGANESFTRVKALLSASGDTKTSHTKNFTTVNDETYRVKVLEIGEERMKKKENLWFAKTRMLGSQLRNRDQT